MQLLPEDSQWAVHHCFCAAGGRRDVCCCEVLSMADPFAEKAFT